MSGARPRTSSPRVARGRSSIPRGVDRVRRIAARLLVAARVRLLAQLRHEVGEACSTRPPSGTDVARERLDLLDVAVRADPLVREFFRRPAGRKPGGPQVVGKPTWW